MDISNGNPVNIQISQGQYKSLDRANIGLIPEEQYSEKQTSSKHTLGSKSQLSGNSKALLDLAEKRSSTSIKQ